MGNTRLGAKLKGKKIFSNIRVLCVLGEGEVVVREVCVKKNDQKQYQVM